MISYMSHELYKEDIKYVVNLQLPWEKLKDRRILMSGATGQIGSFFVDVVHEKNKSGLNCSIVLITRNKENAEQRFKECVKNDEVIIVEHDVNVPLANVTANERFDYIIHLASNTHPIAYTTDPIGTITTNVLGCINLLNVATRNRNSKFILASSNEIYGQNRGDQEFFDEKYCGYIDCNTLRAGYPESKRCAEAICQAYRKQYGLDISIARFTRTYGPNLLISDSKAMSQFLKNGMKNENIVLKSNGEQYYSYTYVADAVSGLITVMLLGENGEAYNIADEKSDATLREVAEFIANRSGTKVVYEIPEEIERSGFSVVTKARLNSEKLKMLGWKVKYSIEDGIERTLKIEMTRK